MTGPVRLRDNYEALLLDLDGTLYLGPVAIPGAAAALSAGSERHLYVTNNASRAPGDVAEHLDELGFPASESDVVTSSQAAARLLAEHLESGAAVLIVGAEALADEVARVGLRPVRSFDDKPSAVVQGHSPDTAWPILAEAAYAIRSGALWIASNTDTTLPTDRGLAPGNGSIVAALRVATGSEPIVAGKPAEPLMEDALRRSGTRSSLVVGDRLDTDIEGANAVALDSLLVLTGVSTADDLLRAEPALRPTFVAFSMDGLNEPAAQSAIGGESEWTVEFDGGDLVVSAPAGESDSLEALRAVAPVAWAHPDFGSIRGSDERAEQAISSWQAPAERVSVPAATTEIR